MEGLQGGIGNAMEIEPAEEIEEVNKKLGLKYNLNLGSTAVY